MPPKDVSKTRNILSLEDKINLLTYYKQTKCSIRKLATHFNIGKTQASLIVKQEQVLYEHWLSGRPGIVRKYRSGVGNEIDKKVYDWYLTKIQDNQVVTGSALQSKALEFAKDLGSDTFKASNGWLAKFVKRHGISFNEGKTKNKSKSKQEEVTNNFSFELNEWSDTVSFVMNKYSDDDIFSAVQTGLFFRSVPDDTLNLFDKTCADGAFCSERFTVLLCTAMSGQKEKPLVIVDRSEEEVKNLKLSEINCKSNSSAWLTKNIINEWLTDLDNKMREQERNIALFLDQSLPCHDCLLSNVNVLYFPNVLSNGQRANQNIVYNFKVAYRLELLRHLVYMKEKSLSESFKNDTIDVPQALTWINSSWKELSPNVIQKCFEQCFFNVTLGDEFNEKVSATLKNISDLLHANDSLIKASDYVSVDDCLVTEKVDPTAIEVLVDVNDIYADSDEEISDVSNNVMPNMDADIFYSESLKGLKHLEQFYLSQNDSNGTLLVKQLIAHHENVLSAKNS